MEAYDRLVRLVQDVADEVRKAEGGNKAAGTRVRKAMQDIKAAAQEVRTGILESREPAPPPAKTGSSSATGQKFPSPAGGGQKMGAPPPKYGGGPSSMPPQKFGGGGGTPPQKFGPRGR
jgi:hypothetical protein